MTFVLFHPISFLAFIKTVEEVVVDPRTCFLLLLLLLLLLYLFLIPVLSHRLSSEGRRPIFRPSRRFGCLPRRLIKIPRISRLHPLARCGHCVVPVLPPPTERVPLLFHPALFRFRHLIFLLTEFFFSPISLLPELSAGSSRQRAAADRLVWDLLSSNNNNNNNNNKETNKIKNVRVECGDVNFQAAAVFVCAFVERSLFSLGQRRLSFYCRQHSILAVIDARRPLRRSP